MFPMKMSGKTTRYMLIPVFFDSVTATRRSVEQYETDGSSVYCTTSTHMCILTFRQKQGPACKHITLQHYWWSKTPQGAFKFKKLLGHQSLRGRFQLQVPVSSPECYSWQCGYIFETVCRPSCEQLISNFRACYQGNVSFTCRRASLSSCFTFQKHINS